MADDDSLIRQLISTALAHDGFAVKTAGDGEQAWEELHREHYDLLITDNEMPRLKGIKLIEHLRKEGLSLPVIIASATISADMVRDARELHIAAVLLKPFDLVQFLDIVRFALESADEPVPVDHEASRQTNPSLSPIRPHNEQNPKP